MGKQIYLNAFDMNCAGHQSPGLWAHPDDHSDEYKNLDYWVKLAQTLERGKFDGIFLADVIGVYDVYKHSPDVALRSGAQVPMNDPLLLVSAMAHVTRHLGFGVTSSTTHEHPYSFARRMSTLDHLTNGRVGWNIVTSYLDSAAKNLGLPKKWNHDERYDVADEYLDVCYKLWETSWEDGAVIKDKEKRIFTDPEKVHPIQHHGKYFDVPGIHLSEPSPQRTPVLYQAGSSSRGRAFAGKHAECVFISFPSIVTAAACVKDIRRQAEKAGRRPEDIKIFSLFTPIVGRTEAEAKEKYEDLKSYISFEGALALLGGWTGVDFSGFDPDQVLEHIQTNAIRSVLEQFTIADPNKKWTLREVAQFVGLGGHGAIGVGTPAQIADKLQKWVDEAGVDGFNIAYATAPGTINDFVDLVIPELQERGIFKTDYADGTLRQKLFGKGDRLTAPHPGAAYHIEHQQI